MHFPPLFLVHLNFLVHNVSTSSSTSCTHFSHCASFRSTLFHDEVHPRHLSSAVHHLCWPRLGPRRFTGLCRTWSISPSSTRSLKLMAPQKPCASKLPANCGIKIECICASQDWITSISCCVANACSEADQKSMQSCNHLGTRPVLTQSSNGPSCSKHLRCVSPVPWSRNTLRQATGDCNSLLTRLLSSAKVTLPTAAVCPGATGASTAGSSTSNGGSSTATASSTMTGSNTAGSRTMGSTTSPSAAAATAGSSSGAGIQHVAPGLCGVAAVFGLALL